MKLLTAVSFAALLVVSGGISDDDTCAIIQESLSSAATAAGIENKKACRCFLNGQSTSPNVKAEAKEKRATPETFLDGQNLWIGCTRQIMNHIFGAINSLNETFVSKLWIWDSSVPSVPTDMFNKIRPQTLIMEGSDVSLFRDGVFAPLATVLRRLDLKHNIIKSIEPRVFKPLTRLHELDLSNNKIEQIRRTDLESLVDLQSLVITDNSIRKIQDGAFERLKKLKSLNLAHNRLVNVTRDMLRGLDDLEHLDLSHNKLRFVDWAAFTNLKRLKSLNIGYNFELDQIELRGLASLQRLYINNNSIRSLRQVSLRHLTALILLSIDQTKIDRIDDDDLRWLSSSPELRTLSLASNQIVHIGLRAFEPLHRLETLSLQYNKLRHLSFGHSSILRPLNRLQNLFLSGNKIDIIEQNSFEQLTDLRILTLDHNELVSFSDRALVDNTRLTRFYLNNNRLTRLGPEVFTPIQKSIYILDISHNPWQCDCSNAWLGEWLNQFKERSIHLDDTACFNKREELIEEKNCKEGEMGSGEDGHSEWITTLGVVMGLVSLLILLAIACLYLQDGRKLLAQHAENAKNVARAVIGPQTKPPPNIISPVNKGYDLSRVPSDMVRLIPSRCSGNGTNEKKHVRFDVNS